MQQAYTLMDARTFSYSVYDPVNDCIGTVSVVNEDNPDHCWQIIDAEDNRYLYNLGAKKFVTSFGNTLKLTNEATAIKIADSKDGILLGTQEDHQWVFVNNERINVGQSIADTIIALRATSYTPQKDEIFDLSGRKLSVPQKGLNIIRMSDGTSKKVLIK